MHSTETNIQVVLYIANKLQEKNIELSETKLYKLLWFASLWMADNEYSLILHDVFIRKQFGPVPENIFEYVNDIKNHDKKSEYIKIDTVSKNGASEPYTQYNIIGLSDFDENFFTEDIKKALDFSISNYGHLTAKKLTELSHKKAWENASDNQLIDITQDMNNSDYKEIVKDQYEDIVYIQRKLKYAI